MGLLHGKSWQAFHLPWEMELCLLPHPSFLPLTPETPPLAHMAATWWQFLDVLLP